MRVSKVGPGRPSALALHDVGFCVRFLVLVYLFTRTYMYLTHNAGQLGTDACKLGVVIAVSQLERTIIIWRGNGLDKVLTQGRVGEVRRKSCYTYVLLLLLPARRPRGTRPNTSTWTQIGQHAREYFRAGDYDGGVLAAVNGVEGAIFKGPVNEPEQPGGGSGGGGGTDPFAVIMSIIGLCAGLGGIMLCAYKANKEVRSTSSGLGDVFVCVYM